MQEIVQGMERGKEKRRRVLSERGKMGREWDIISASKEKLGAAIFRKMGKMEGEISESQTLKRRSPTCKTR